MDSLLITRKAIRFRIAYLLLVSAALHLSVIAFPSNGDKVFDESFYVPAANDILKGIPSNMEHPFLGKLWGAIGIATLGDNWLGWRIPIVIFGILTLYIFYYLAKLFMDEKKALIATAFLSFDTILFAHSSLLLLDVPALFFGILGLYLYFRKHNVLSAACFGIAILSKEWAIMFVIALLIYHIMIIIKDKKSLFRTESHASRSILVEAAKFSSVLILVVIVPLWAYISIYQPKIDTDQLDSASAATEPTGPIAGNIPATGHQLQIDNPIEQMRYMLNYQTELAAKYEEKTRSSYNYPWGWIIPYEVKPQTYYETNIAEGKVIINEGTPPGPVTLRTENPISWKGIGNLPIWLGIWFIAPPAILRIVKKKASKLDYLMIAWIASTYLPWFYVSGVLHRTVYPFYFINVVPFLALCIPNFIGSISKGKSETLITLIWLASSVIFFFYYYPIKSFDMNAS